MDQNNALIQYLELYNGNRDLFARGSDPYMTDLRERAYAKLRNSLLPDKNVEGYEKTSLNEMFKPDLGINIHGHELIQHSGTFTCGTDLYSAIRIIVDNDIITRIELPKGMKELPQGLKVKALNDIKEGKEREFVEKSLSGVFDVVPNEAELLNIMIGTRGIFIEVDAGVKLEVPVQIVNYSGGKHPLLSSRRVFVLLNENSALDLLSCDHEMAGSAFINVSNILSLFTIKRGASFHYVDMEETGILHNRIANFHVGVESDAMAEFDCVTLMNGVTRNNFYIDCVGNGEDVKINGLAIGKSSSHIDNYTSVSHRGEHQHSDQLFKYSLYDSSQGVFGGTITVDKGSRFNEAYQNNRNVLASSKARMYSKPQLLIYNDDVKCSHGATTGQLDPRAVYYMETRGIPRDEAEAMLMQAFMNDIVERIHFPGLKERLLHLVEKRLKGEDALCSACKIHPDA